MAISPSKLPPISQKSNEVIWVPLRSEHPITGVQVLTALPVELAFKLDDDPETADWFPATWESTPWNNPEDGLDYYLAKLEIGPGGAFTFTKGNWLVWARIDSGSDKPVIGPTILKVI